MQKASGLGRGLGSLIPDKTSKPISSSKTAAPASVKTNGEEIVQIPVEKLSPNPHQPRQDFDEEALKELADSIKEHGVIQPIIAVSEADGWQIIAGERRWRASQIAKLKTIPAIVRDMNKQKKMEIALIENLQRKDLNILEVAEAYQRLMDEFNLTMAEVGKKVGKSRPHINNIVRLLKTAPEVKQAISEGKIVYSQARSLAALPHEEQVKMLEKILNKELIGSMDISSESQKVMSGKHSKPKKHSPEVLAKIDDLQEALGTKVSISGSKEKGQIIIKYFSAAELSDIVNKISQ